MGPACQGARARTAPRATQEGQEPTEEAAMDEDEAVKRMRAADPAAGSEPDAERLADLTAQRRGDELAGRRERRSPRWAAVAAVAAGAVLPGGGLGYGPGRAPHGPPPTPAPVPARHAE